MADGLRIRDISDSLAEAVYSLSTSTGFVVDN
jgi:hypothetical protein